MKKTILFLILALFVSTNLLAQEEAIQEVKEKDKPVRFAWESGVLIDNQTSFIPSMNTLEYVIQHKFGTVDNGSKDLYGIFAPAANVRFGLNYVVAKNVQIGWGITKQGSSIANNSIHNDFNAKWTIFEQTRKNKVPVFVTVYANAAINGKTDDLFGQLNNYEIPLGLFEYKFKHRLSYFAEVLVGRKLSDAISMQVGLSFSHANLVDAWHDHDRIGLHFNGRAKVSPQGAIIFNLDFPLEIDDISEQHSGWNASNTPGWDGPYHPEPNLTFGYEVSTSTHAFQIFMGNSSGILIQDIMMNNFNKIKMDNFAIGFTITRLWSF